MYYPSLEDFRKKAQHGNLIPVYKSILADMETPVSTFNKIDAGEYSFLLESVEGGNTLEGIRFSVVNHQFCFRVKKIRCAYRIWRQAQQRSSKAAIHSASLRN